MKNRFLYLMVVWAGAAVAQCLAPTQPSSQPVRTTGIITQLQPGNFTPHSDAGPDDRVLVRACLRRPRNPSSVRLASS
jgi:hypothetical protein